MSSASMSRGAEDASLADAPVCSIRRQNETHRRLEEPEPALPRTHPRHVRDRPRRGLARDIPRALPCGTCLSVPAVLRIGAYMRARLALCCLRTHEQMMRQGANSAVRFTTYTTLKQMVQGQSRPGQPISSATTFGIGAIAGLVTVYTTMPLECVHPSASL